MEESELKNIRERKSAIYDKKRSAVNYLKNDNISNEEDKIDFIKKLTGSENFNLKNLDINKIIENNPENLPKPPTFSNDQKIYNSDPQNYESKNYFVSSQSQSCRLHIHTKSTIIKGFDSYLPLESELSLVNLENYLAKFDEDELSELTVKDILTFESKEFKGIKNKLEEILEIGLKSNDNEIITLLNEKIKSLESNTNNLNLIIKNLDKVDDFVILNETLKFFFTGSDSRLSISISTSK
jgi:hypothetical protein